MTYIYLFREPNSSASLVFNLTRRIPLRTVGSGNGDQRGKTYHNSPQTWHQPSLELGHGKGAYSFGAVVLAINKLRVVPGGPPDSLTSKFNQ